MRSIQTLAGLALLTFLMTDLARAENYAFLVAVQDYNVKDLRALQFTRSDILDFAKVLHASGFKEANVVLMTDKCDQRRYDSRAENIRQQFDLLLSGIREKDTVIVAFSGHGVQFEGEEKNYYCPLDADLEDPKRKKLIAIMEIYDKLKNCPAEKKLLVVDACRNDPLSPVKKARQTVRLQSITRPQTEPVPKGIVALFSCSAGQESYEWPDLKHGVFFHHFLEGWKGAADDGDKSLTLLEVMGYATDHTQTFARTKIDSAQTPQLKSDFQGTWIVRALGKAKPGQPTLPATPSVSGDAKIPDADDPQDVKTRIGMRLRLIPAGDFLMGSPSSEEGRKDDEVRHHVRITEPFLLGKFEVTQSEFQKLIGRNPSAYSEFGKQADAVDGSNTEQFPVENVTWFDAVNFCNKLSESDGLPPYYELDLSAAQLAGDKSILEAVVKTKGGLGYHLPTEAQWEYACRAGSKKPFHFESTAVTGSRYKGGSENLNAWGVLRKKNGEFGNGPTTVGRFPANRHGLYDMHGNVAEWCQDFYGPYLTAISPALDPEGLKPKYGNGRVVRGGYWGGGRETCRSAIRKEHPQRYRDDGVGFRVSRAAPRDVNGKNPAPGVR